VSRRRARATDDGVFWISYSDLSTALLAVFILAIAVMIKQHGEEQVELLAKVRELQELREQLARRLHTAKTQANAELGEEVFGFDSVDQRVYVIDTTWFDLGKHELSGGAERALGVFYPHLYDAIFAETESGRKPADYLLSIEVQGHTDATWNELGPWSWDNYRENALLSRQRAAAIATYLGGEFNREVERPWLQFFGLVETSGRSWTQSYCSGRRLVPEDFQAEAPPCPAPTADDEKRSRRVTFGFRMNDMRLLEDIKAILDKHGAT